MESLLDDKFIETSEAIVAQLGYKDIKSFIKNQTLMMLLAKLDKYESENKYFERKYQMPFEKFKCKLDEQKGSEDFEEEDDFLDWSFAVKAIENIEKEKQAMKHA